MMNKTKGQSKVKKLRNVRLITPDGLSGGYEISIEGSRIVSLEKPDKIYPEALDETVIDCKGLIASPGFIDVHIQGGGGSCVMDGTCEAIDVICETHARYGTTGLLLTPIPDKEGDYKNLRTISEAIDTGTDGASILGIHLEGPFINPKMKGGFSLKHIEKPSVDLFKKYEEACGDRIRLCTIAPELEGSDEVIDYMVSEGVVVSIGHTDASYGQVKEAVSKGVSHVTHLFNAMRPFHHREPGVVGGSLLMDELTVQIIADGIHIHPAGVDLAVRAKGTERIVLITDAVKPLDMPEGRYPSFGYNVIVKDGSVRLEDGTLSGSLLSMNRAVSNTCNFAGLTLWESVNMASLNPARVMRLSDRKGSIEPGKDADIVLLDDDFNVHLTMVEGKIVFSSDDRSM